MIRANAKLTAALAATLFAAAAAAGEPPPPRALAFATLPDWTGIWETEAAAASVSGAGAQAAAKGASLLPPDFKSCHAAGFPAIMNVPLSDFMFELLVTPEQTMLAATDGTVRHVYTDGRAHPKPADLWPTAAGDSIGHWDRKTLVIDTVAREAGPISPFPGSPNLSTAAHFTERLRRLDANTMEDEMTIDDPKRLTRPMQSRIRYTRVRDIDRLIPIDCEHDRDPVVNGKTVVAPP
ncbi:MAG TPA: hypothetical protein VGV09_03960 [Steroidobacteraceae bacterium]|nr:hypothetical protein [Steroidobacteraceae bacterium]